MGNPEISTADNEAAGKEVRTNPETDTDGPEGLKTELSEGVTQEESPETSETESPEEKRLSDTYEENLELGENIYLIKKDIEAMGDIRADLQVASSGALESGRSGQDLTELEKKQEELSDKAASAEKECLGAPDETGELQESQEAVMAAQEIQDALQESEEMLREAREQALDDWIEGGKEHFINAWKTELNQCENSSKAEYVIKAKVEYFLRNEGRPFVEGDSDFLPGCTGHMSMTTVETKNGPKTYVTKINFGPYTGSSDGAEEDQGSGSDALGDPENAEDSGDKGVPEVA